MQHREADCKPEEVSEEAGGQQATAGPGEPCAEQVVTVRHCSWIQICEELLGKEDRMGRGPEARRLRGVGPEKNASDIKPVTSLTS